MTEVICTKCLTAKPAGAFNAHRGRPNGLQAHCKECRRAYRQANREKLAEAQREYHKLEDPAVAAAYKRDWYLKNVELAKARAAAHRLANPARARQSARKSLYLRRALKFGFAPVVEEFTEAEVIARYGDACFYCRDAEFEELDHVVPVRHGGAHVLDNVRPSCAACNRRKGNQTYEKEMDARWD